MTTRMILLATTLGLLAGCASIAESRINPLNWFGRAEPVADGPASLLPAAVSANHGPLVAQISALRIERTSTGAIIHAEAVTPALGYWDAVLVPVPATVTGEYTWHFHMRPPPETRLIGSPAQRRVDAAVTLGNRELALVREIRVVGANNAMALRR